MIKVECYANDPVYTVAFTFQHIMNWMNKMEENRKLALFIFGLPGSGKTSLANSLSLHGFVPISIGALLRNYIETSYEDADKAVAQNVIKTGSSTPLYLVKKLIEHKFASELPDRIVFDNYPRDAAQFNDLDRLLDPWGFRQNDRFAILLNAQKEVLQERIRQRLTCKECQALASSKDTICQVCGGDLVKRTDDDETIIEKRIVWFNEHVAQIVSMFKNNNRLIAYSSELPLQTIQTDLVERLEL